MDAPGVTVLRPLTVFGYDEAPYGHAEVDLKDVRVPVANLVLGEGDGFKIAQGRLGPGRIHHCMRAIGLAERVLALAVARAMQRKAFGRELARQATVQRDLAQCRMELDQARLLVLHAAWRMDAHGGAKGAQQEIAMIKAVAPNMGQRVVDVAIQLHGGAGVSEDTILARAFAYMRCLRIADGPDEVHVRCVLGVVGGLGVLVWGFGVCCCLYISECLSSSRTATPHIIHNLTQHDTQDGGPLRAEARAGGADAPGGGRVVPGRR